MKSKVNGVIRFEVSDRVFIVRKVVPQGILEYNQNNEFKDKDICQSGLVLTLIYTNLQL